MRSLARNAARRNASLFASPLRAREDGQMAIMMVLMILVVFMIFTLAMDVGLWVVDHRIAQNQADGAAHAAAVEMVLSPQTTSVPVASTVARARALEWLQSNGVADPIDQECDWGWFNALDADGDGKYDRAVVCLTRPSMSFFGNLAGIDSATISAKATAELAWEPLRYALMAMHDTDCNALSVGGTGGVTIVDTSGTGGATYTESSSTCPSGALSVGGSSYLRAVSHEVVGGADYNASPCPEPPGGGCLTGTVREGTSRVPDPWAGLAPPVPPLPTLPSNCVGTTTFSGNDVAIIQPGVYCTELRASGGARVSVAPGVYILLRGMSVNVSENQGGFFCSQTFDASDVAIFVGQCPLDSQLATGDYRAETLFYSTCNPTPCTPPVSPACNPATCSGESAGNISFQGGGGQVNLTGSADHEDILLWMDRTSQVSPQANVTLVGGSEMRMQGHIYALTSDVSVSGNNASEVLRLNMTILADTIGFSGSSAIEMAWDFDDAVKLWYVALIE